MWSLLALTPSSRENYTQFPMYWEHTYIYTHIHMHIYTHTDRHTHVILFIKIRKKFDFTMVLMFYVQGLRSMYMRQL